MPEKFLRLDFWVLVDRERVILDVLDHQLVDAFLLGSVKHDLINSLSEETLGEPANGVLGVRLIQYLDQVPRLQYLEYVNDLLVGLMPQRTDVLKDHGPELVPDHCGTFQE